MAKYNFALARFAGYYFNDEDNCVYSAKRKGAPVKMSWNRRNNSESYVTLSVGYRQSKETMTLSQVRNALKSTPIAEPLAVSEFIAAYPEADSQQLRTLIRNVADERSRNKPPKHYRALFQMIRALLEARGSTASEDSPPI